MSTGRLLSTPSRGQWQSRSWFLPSWLISLCVHIAAVLVVAQWLSHWQVQPVGFSDEPSREVGIVLKSSGVSVAETEQNSDSEALDPPPVDEQTPMPVAQPTTAPLSTPAPSPATETPAPSIGAGALFPATVQADPRELIKAGGAVTANAALAGAMPGAVFMGARDNGTRVVFAIDCSASMANFGAMRSAKAALMSSLQTLSDTQQFQVLFYNQSPHLLTVRGKSNSELLFATEINKSFARQHISGIEPDLGTDHIPALRMALRLAPEVLFFLTDADEPQLTAAELNEIQRLNQGRTRIHCIEFGTGGSLDIDNFLKKLARQNGGTYRYYDVKRLANP